MLLHFQNKTGVYLVDVSFGVQYMSVTNTKDLIRHEYHLNISKGIQSSELSIAFELSEPLFTF